MSIDTYKLTSMEEPTDEVLSQLMREAAQDAQKANEQATQRYFEELQAGCCSHLDYATNSSSSCTYRDSRPKWVW